MLATLQAVLLPAASPAITQHLCSQLCSWQSLWPSLGTAMFWEIWILYFFSGHTGYQHEFPMALIDDFRNNHILLNSVIYKERRKVSKKCNRFSQLELSYLPKVHYMPVYFSSFLSLDHSLQLVS